MNIENSKAQMRKGILEYCILSMLYKNELYASDIISEMKNAKLIVVEGTLYPLLTRLKNLSYISYLWEESTQGPPRKNYKLTTNGRNFYNELHVSWEELINSVKLINKRNQ